MEPTEFDRKRLNIHFLSSTDSPEFAHLKSVLSRTSVIGLDAEWKPLRTHQSNFPTVSLLQIACQLNADESTNHTESAVFLLDLLAIPPTSIYELLRDMFLSPDILKLGFRFKQDLVYLSSTFQSQGCNYGFDRMEPFLDITSIYNHLHPKQSGQRISKEIKSLAVICKEILGIFLSKELQCSDWSSRPLTEEQMTYAAIDAHCLIEIFNVFRLKVLEEGHLFHGVTELGLSNLDLGLKQILKEPTDCNKISRTNFCEALEMVRAITIVLPLRIHVAEGVTLRESFINTKPMNDTLLQIVRKYCDKIMLKESDRKPRTSKKKSKRKSSAELISKERRVNNVDDYGPPPWDCSLGGDGCPKFLCDVMVEGLAKHLRCVGIDAAVPKLRKPDSRDLIEQTYKEKRVLLTRDAKLLRHDYLISNQIYRVKSLLKNDQLVEVIQTFQLEISENQLMSRCTKCNGKFIQKPLSTEEAIDAAKGFQVIPSCLFDRNLEFWQCMDCNQLYWEVFIHSQKSLPRGDYECMIYLVHDLEAKLRRNSSTSVLEGEEGTQYHNAVQKFIDVCNLNTA